MEYIDVPFPDFYVRNIPPAGDSIRKGALIGLTLLAGESGAVGAAVEGHPLVGVAVGALAIGNVVRLALNLSQSEQISAPDQS